MRLTCSSAGKPVTVSCCGDEVSTSSMSGGRRPKASSRGVLPPYVTETFLAQQASRKIYLGVVVL